MLFYFTALAAAATTQALLFSLLIDIDDPTGTSGVDTFVKIGVFVGLYYVAITPIRVYGVLFVSRFEHDRTRATTMASFITRGLTACYVGMTAVFFDFSP